jgi:hypothetical protein
MVNDAYDMLQFIANYLAGEIANRVTRLGEF